MHRTGGASAKTSPRPYATSDHARFTNAGGIGIQDIRKPGDFRIPSRLLEADLASFDGVFLCNVGRVSKEEAAALHRFVHRGGGLVVFAGDQVLAENYNELLAGDALSRVLPAAPGSVCTE